MTAWNCSEGASVVDKSDFSADDKPSGKQEVSSVLLGISFLYGLLICSLYTTPKCIDPSSFLINIISKKLTNGFIFFQNPVQLKPPTFSINFDRLSYKFLPWLAISFPEGNFEKKWFPFKNNQRRLRIKTAPSILRTFIIKKWKKEKKFIFLRSLFTFTINLFRSISFHITTHHRQQICPDHDAPAAHVRLNLYDLLQVIRQVFVVFSQQPIRLSVYLAICKGIDISCLC